MTLTEDDKKLVLEWLNQKCGVMRCHCCGNAQWQMLEMSSLQIGIDLHTTRFHYHSGMPFISIACANCGNVLQFSPAIMGFKPDTPSKENPSEPAQQ